MSLQQHVQIFAKHLTDGNMEKAGYASKRVRQALPQGAALIAAVYQGHVRLAVVSGPRLAASGSLLCNAEDDVIKHKLKGYITEEGELSQENVMHFGGWLLAAQNNFEAQPTGNCFTLIAGRDDVVTQLINI